VIDLIRLSDETDHGGRVISASDHMEFEGRKVARKGDQVTCPLHNISPNLIMEGDETMLDDGVPIARHGHRAMCGCRLLTSLN